MRSLSTPALFSIIYESVPMEIAASGIGCTSMQVLVPTGLSAVADRWIRAVPGAQQLWNRSNRLGSMSVISARSNSEDATDGRKGRVDGKH